MREFSAEQGYLTFALNTDSVDYLKLAYAQALSIKCTQRINNYAVVVDSMTNQLITDQHRRVFDHVIVLSHSDSRNQTWRLADEWQAFDLTPFRETIKLESDILFSRNIDHWWTGLRLQEVTFTTHIRDYLGTVSPVRDYRKVFDSNHLPNVYNGMFYFRHSRTAMQLFSAAREVYHHWSTFKNQLLKNCRSEQATTDEVFAVAARLIGAEQTINPGLSYPTFVHMKSAINNLANTQHWPTVLPFHIDDDLNIYINHCRQQYPVHYQAKELITDEIITRYEQRLQKLTAGI
jgi:hypothetical protein